ncbi:hypothetical protein BH09SUM1_BH09SUM1_22810 [soil metagenome]
MIVNLFRERPVQKGIGVLACLVVFVYTGWVTVSGGIVNEKHPTEMGGVVDAIYDFEAKGQVSSLLLEESKKPTQNVNQKRVWEKRAILDGVDEQIERHKNLIRKQEEPEEDEIVDLQRFLREELPKIPKEFQVGLPDVQPRTAVYRPGDFYELLSCAPRTPERIFDDYMKKAVEMKWIVNYSRFDRDLDYGILMVEQRKGSIMIVIENKPVFAGYSTLVFWMLEMGEE